MDNGVKTTIQIHKKRIDPEHRMTAKALLLAHFPQLLSGGQLIIHFNPGRNPLFVELQERVDQPETRFQRAG